MCLEPGFRKPTEKQCEGIGWKVFQSDMRGRYVFTPKYNENKWLKEKKFRPPMHSPPLEGFGFHIFLLKRDARVALRKTPGLIMRRVRYRKATAIGIFQAPYAAFDAQNAATTGTWDTTSTSSARPWYVYVTHFFKTKNIVAKEIFIEAEA